MNFGRIISLVSALFAIAGDVVTIRLLLIAPDRLSTDAKNDLIAVMVIFFLILMGSMYRLFKK